MTTVPAVLSDLRRRNVHVTVVGDRLLLDAPVGAVTPRMRAEVSRRKAEILAVLSGGQGTTHVTEITENTQGRTESPITVISVTPSVDGAGHVTEESTLNLDAYSLRIVEAQSWDDLYAILTDAEVAYAAGELSGEEVEVLAAVCAQEANTLPEFEV